MDLPMITSIMRARDALWAASVDETVEVNQRALIDKILARYSGEHTVFRELLQNADDARSKNIEIRFDTTTSNATAATHLPDSSLSSIPDLESVDITKWTFRNDGDRFRPDDWNRLKKIAEGNPDESKIGAFGVGFYALFSVTENPFVTSGNDWMGFYWKDGGDQLYVRRGKLPDVSPQEATWTSFEMDLREHGQISTKPLDLARFCATSITFMNYIRQISVFVDQHRLFTISKASGLSEFVRWPVRLKNESPLKYMMMSSVSLQAVVIVASLTRWVYALGSDSTAAREKMLAKQKPMSLFASLNPFSSLSVSFNTPARSSSTRLTDEEKLQVIERSVQLQIYAGDITVKLPPKIASEIERATRKKSPSNMTYQIVYTDKERYDESVKEDAGLDFTDISVFQGVRADLDGTGSAKLFIGHSTAQSTGVGGHHASRFIPTVEREAVDLVDATVATFNKELLAMGGLLSRVIYETGMDELMKMPKRRGANPDDLEQELDDKFAHLLRFFAFRQSTPSPLVSHILKTAFVGASDADGIRLLSTTGVKESTEVRRYNAELCSFLKTTPFLKPSTSPLAESLLTSVSIAPVRGVDMRDILNELQSRPLGEEEMIKCFKWRLSWDDSIVGPHTQFLNANFLAAATVFIPAGVTKTERVISLGQIQTYYSPSNGVIRQSPLPPHTLPISLGEALPLPKLAAAFAWKPLSPSVWLKFLVVDGVESIADEFQISREASFAQSVLVTISEEAWGTKMSPEEKANTKSVLANVLCIPTNLGLQIPSASYFPNVNMFPDLPIASLPGVEKKGPLQRMLIDLGVRNHVDLQLIFTRHIASGQWSIPCLMSYFVSIRDILTKDEMEKLRRTSMFFAAPGSAMLSNDGMTPKRYLPNQLHEPSSENISLGVPVLDWAGSSWDPKSPEAQFTFSLGLLKRPSVDIIVNIASSNDPIKQDAALHYLLSHFDQHYRQSYTVDAQGKVPFVPAVGSLKLFSPTEIFAQSECAILGFPVVRDDIRRESKKLQISDHPKAAQLVQTLIASPPNTLETQKMVFEYLSSQIAGFQPHHFESLHNAPFILVKEGEQNIFMKPCECYVGSGEGTIHSKISTFVDPRSASAQSFLLACGVRPEPSPQQVVDILLRNPPSFFALAGSESAYLEELRQIAASIRQNRIDARAQGIMKSAPIFFASKVAAVSSLSLSEDDIDTEDEMRTPTESRLLKPTEVIIVDDLVKYRLFKESIWAAPQEDFLEEFYRLFGSSSISSLVQETLSTSGDGNNATATHVRQLVLERLPLFLHDRVGKPTAFKFTWFKASGNFVVKSVKGLNVQNSLKVGRQKIVKSRNGSAGATRIGSGPVILYIAASDYSGQPDLVEVAHAVCQVMFKQHTGNDSLLLSTILSTELRALKRIGYDVDRIVAQQRESTGSRKRPEEGAMKFDLVESKSSLLPAAPTLQYSSPVAPSRNNGQQVTGVLKSSIDSIKNRMLPPKATFGSKLMPAGLQFANASGIRPDNSQSMTPTQDIERNMQLALAACSMERTNRIESRSQMSIVKETQNSGYCDESANANIQFIKQVAGYRIWAANGISKPDLVIGAKSAAIERFANILALLRDHIFKIGDSVSIFYDLDGPLIAFNRNGSIFVNLRVYEQWHDQSLAKGQRIQAISFYYFVLGHEIAHNLVDVHNAEHEFYFSALCEKHLALLAPFLVDQ